MGGVSTHSCVSTWFLKGLSTTFPAPGAIWHRSQACMHFSTQQPLEQLGRDHMAVWEGDIVLPVPLDIQGEEGRLPTTQPAAVVG